MSESHHKTHGFGRYPAINASIMLPDSYEQCREMVLRQPLIARGLGRSYGDSSLSRKILSLYYLDHFLDFDEQRGILTCSGGAVLNDIVKLIVPKGWFLPVTPGTRFVTVGGAVAADVHGKNHVLQGQFCDHVISISLLLGNGECVHISRTEKPELFAATCGGMGLTGVILTVRIQLMAISSANLITNCIQAKSLDALLDSFEEYADTPYLVAWVDALSGGKKLGRGVLRLGHHASDEFKILPKPKFHTLRVNSPSWVLNAWSMKCFNTMYYRSAARLKLKHRMSLLPFFYPLDSLLNWNKLYGRAGLLQYQCVLPPDAARLGLKLLLTKISQSQLGSFLAVLKRFGASSSSYLSFPQEGFTLALDFQVKPAVFELMNSLDVIVKSHGGRLYLAKDARMGETMFKATYPEWEAFEKIRAKYHAIGVFSSLQSQRLGLA